MTTSTFRFGEYCLEPAARELRRKGELMELSRLPFNGLVVLVENRDRAVSRDELIEAVWGRTQIEDVQVSQVIMRLRRAIGDDSHEPRFVRTVPGFGYRWIAETEEITAGESAPKDFLPPVDSPSRDPAASGLSGYLRWSLLALLIGALVALIANLIVHRETHAPPLAPVPGEAVVVLPLEVRTSGAGDDSWVRLGAMDLIAGRLRDAGLPVPLSDSVVAALHGAGTDISDRAELASLRQTLGAGLVVQGVATRVREGWLVELSATAADNERRLVESSAEDIVAAATQGANLLLAALGQVQPVSAASNTALSEILQRSRAAALALELDTARQILLQAPQALHDEPALRLQLAWIAHRAGLTDEARERTDTLLPDRTVLADPRLHAEVLVLNGFIQSREHQDYRAAERSFDGAVVLLQDEAWTHELGIALASRGLARAAMFQFDAALRDLGQARTILEFAGDRLSLVRINNYFGALEMRRGRVTDALPYYRTAVEISEAFGHVDWQRANLVALLNGHADALQWSEALYVSEQVRGLRERIADRVYQTQIDYEYARILTAIGRLDEAAAILADIEQIEADLPDYAVRENLHARAELAWRQGNPDQAFQAAARALELWPQMDSSAISHPTRLGLLYQRAAIATGRPGAAEEQIGRVVAEHAEYPLYLVIRAEWQAYRGEDGAAEALFREAAFTAERQATPATLVRVVDAYARWLLSRERASEALALAGRVSNWASDDYDSALLRVATLHAIGQRDAWTVALRQAQQLAGEREIPDNLLAMPE